MQSFGTNGFGSASNAANNGTANPPFSVFSEKEGTGAGSTNHFQSITCMPAYANSSFEELRVQDYNQNRKSGAATTSVGFGGIPFGSTPSNTTGIFGNTQPQISTFGQPNGSPGTSIFGQSNNAQASNIFGTSTNQSPSTFGQTPGLFGNTSSTPASTGIFGTNATSSAFGTNTNAAQSSTPSFGQPNVNPFGSQSSPGVFGSANNTAGTHAFGQNSTTGAKPFSFGGNATPALTFGQSNAAATNGNSSNAFGVNSSSAPSLFGANNSNNPSSNAFGSSTTNNTAGGGFNFGGATSGNSGQSGNNNSGTFSFGGATPTQNTSSAQKPFSFGTPATGVSGTFGSTAAKPFSFGHSSSSTPNLGANGGSGLFGQNNTNATSTGNSLFGNKSSSNMFANNNNSNMPSTPNLFGKSTTNSVFSSSDAPFSSNGSTGLFGNGPNSTPGNLANTTFGNSQPANSNFGQSQLTNGQSLQTSIASNVYGGNPLFTSIQPQQTGISSSLGPLATPLVTNSNKKKLATLPHFKLATRSPTSTRSVHKAIFNNDSPSAFVQRSAFPVFDEDLLISPAAFSPRTNLKRLVIERRSDELDLLSGGLDMKGSRIGPPKESEALAPVRNPLPRQAQTGSEPEAHQTSQPPKTEVNAPEDSEVASKAADLVKKEAPPSIESGSVPLMPGSPQASGSYWTLPPIKSLLDLSKVDLSKVTDFKVGRRGYGQISFTRPVDLSSLERIEDIIGNIVSFEGKMCTVYPDERLKPPIGKGLNVPATITLEHCYPLSKDKREPIRDENHPRFQQHVDRLKRMSQTTFVDYLADSGSWIFQVEHF